MPIHAGSEWGWLLHARKLTSHAPSSLRHGPERTLAVAIKVVVAGRCPLLKPSMPRSRCVPLLERQGGLRARRAEPL